MGRSVPPWRTRVEVELERWHGYRRALPASEQAALDALFDEVRQRSAAGGMLPSLETWHPMVLSMAVGLMVRIGQLDRRLSALEARRVDD
jgi:hypothetical protein